MLPAGFIKKEILAQAFSCGFCEMFKNTFFIEYLRETTSNICNNITMHYLNYLFNGCSNNKLRQSNPSSTGLIFDLFFKFLDNSI